MQAAVNAAFAVNGGYNPPSNGQFSSERFAFLFKPGSYSIDVPVGYYTQVLGLGSSPDDTVFTSAKGVYCEAGSTDYKIGALNNFWRSAENFKTMANYEWTTGNGMLWAVSQASPLRRVHVANGNLVLYEYFPPYDQAGYASGGFVANVQVEEGIIPGSQQQWFTRNSQFSEMGDTVWNQVVVGCSNSPDPKCGPPGSSTISVETTPLIAEKPFISANGDNWVLNVPEVKAGSSGVDFAPGQQISFEQVFVASSSDTAARINSKLALGLHVVFSPGIYSLNESLKVVKTNQVLLGIGMATLIPPSGEPAIVVSNVDGVRLAGLLVQAGSELVDTMVKWGEGAYAGNSSNPSFFYDMFIRVGGPDTTPVQATSMMTINSGHVIGDNMWLWRADHTVSGIVSGGANRCDTGLVVNGDDVTLYGAAVEHTLKDLLIWNGERGKTFFFQSELPYDVTQAYGDAGYAAYRVADSVRTHHAWGVGVYHYFRDYPVVVRSGIAVPAAVESTFYQPLSVFLNGDGTIDHIINQQVTSQHANMSSQLFPIGHNAESCPNETLPRTNACL